MPEYLAPGVYVEETSFRAKSIEGVGTSTTAFVGPARKGPFRANPDVPETPELLTSYGDFERIYGSFADLRLGDPPVATTNFLAHAVLAFFNEGGSRLYVARVVGAGATPATVPVRGGAADEQVQFVARFPGAVGNGRIVVRETVAPAARSTMDAAPAGTLLRTGPANAPVHHVKVGDGWRPAANLDDPAADAAALAGATPRIVTLLVVTTDGDEDVASVEGLGFDRSHPRWVGHAMAERPARRSDHLGTLFAVRIGAGVSAIELRDALFQNAAANAQGELEARFTLGGGLDGAVPSDDNYRVALLDIAALEDVSIVAAPGAAAHAAIAEAVNARLIAHASARRAYRIVVLDTPRGQTPAEARAVKSVIDSRYAALYYPWVVVPNPLARPGRDDVARELTLPPSGFVCGIYARNDVERGVHKAPANEVVRSALRFEIDVNFGQQEMLNPLGVNCLRLLSGRGYRVWGARLACSDPEWKYVSDRRYFNYLEASIDRGTQWAVFEPNGERLWANVRQTIADFLYNEWRNGALLGTTVEEAFFVRCDRSTMTQNDLDNGRLVCLIGVAIIRPAEFVIFRIGQKTADARA
jgi:phage tail sheath protein FI